MKRYTASHARESLAQVLDEAEKGQAVVVERRGRRFRIVPEPIAARWPKKVAPWFVADAKLLASGWSWDWRGPGGSVRLAVGRGRRAAK